MMVQVVLWWGRGRAIYLLDLILCFVRLLLFLVVDDGCANGVLCQHAAMKLYRWQRKVLCNFSILDLKGFCNFLTLWG